MNKFILFCVRFALSLPPKNDMWRDLSSPDFEEYVATKERIYADYEDRMAWAKKMLVNISKAGFFSSDRTIAQYNEDIWHL